MAKRTVAVFCALVLASISLYYRLYNLSLGDGLTMASGRQSSRTLEVAANRGMIYDRNLQPLVNLETQNRAAILPVAASMKSVVDVVSEGDREGVLALLQQGKPFALNLSVPYLYAKGVHVFEVYQRYQDPPLAPHIIGYTDSSGKKGVTGIEKAYDSLLNKPQATIRVSYQVDALGNPIDGISPRVEKSQYEVKEGVVLTLDREIQEICEQAAREHIDKGAIVVMDPYNGDLLACVSMPEFSQNRVADSLNQEDSPFFNRVLGAYNVGSTFKIVMACAALENGISPKRTYECKGYENIKGQIFYCNNLAGHGRIDLKTAIQESCNTYFIDLMKDLGPRIVSIMARNMGFGTADQLAEGLVGAAGNLPSEDTDLINPAEAANFSFGQGKLMATPLQIAKMLSAVVNGGSSVSPRLVEGMTDSSGTQIVSHNPYFASNTVFSSRTAALVKDFLIEVVENGSGIYAKPKVGSAGGKTGSAQTGLFRKQNDEEGEPVEIVHAWFAGFYPALEPKYTIVVLVEDGESGAHAAAPIFQQIADALSSKT